jgi:PAS domain S-box-containing protein
MRDDQKTKQQLIEELVALRRMISDVERLKSEYGEAKKAAADEKRISNTLIESLPGIFYLFDEQGRFLRWNRNLELVSGYSAAEIANMRPLDFFEGEDRRIEEEHIRDVFQKGPTTSEAELVSKDGRRTPFFFTCRMVAVGDRRCAIGTGIDIAEQRQTEETVRLLNRQNELILRSAGEGIYGVDLHGNLTFINPSAAKMIGWEAGEMIGKKQHDLMHHTKPDGTPYPNEECPIYAAVNDGKVHQVADEVFWRKDGTCFPVEYTSTPIMDNNRLVGAVVVFRDATERKYAAEEIEKNYDTQTVINSLLNLSLQDVPLDEILERALDLILSISWLVVQSKGGISLVEQDTGTLVLKAHQGFNELLQKVCATVPFGKCICGRAALSKEIVFVDRIDERHEITYDGITPHGHYCVPIIFADNVLGVINVYVDEGHKSTDREKAFLLTIANTLAGIIVRRRAEESLLESERKLQAITDAASDAIVLIDDEEKIVYWNPAASIMLGYQPGEVAGEDIHVIVPQRYRERHIRAFRQFVETGQGALLGKTYEVSALRKDGAEIPVELSISGIRLKGRWHSAGIIRDISERKKLEQQLVQSQKMEAVGQLAGGIAHDFNNILSAIVGYGDLLRIKMNPDDPLRMNVKHLLDAANQAAHLTKSLLAFSRQQILQTRPTDLAVVIRQVERLLRRVIGENIELRTIFKQDAATINADSSQLEQVFMNLAINARDAMPRGGIFVIELGTIDLDDAFIRAHGYGEPGRYALVSVADTGVGMDEATRKKIFEPFFTTKEVGKGTGLGLSIVYGIIKQHHGYINVYSEPGEGTTFKIYLPLIEREAENPTLTAGISEEKFPSGTETVLVAEDDEALRKLSHTVLKEAGYTVIEAGDGADAVHQFMMHRDVIKLVILDMIMPKKNGREAYQEMKKIQPAIKALFVSGYTADKELSDDLIVKDLEFLMKPLSPVYLLKKVRAILDS